MVSITVSNESLLYELSQPTKIKYQMTSVHSKKCVNRHAVFTQPRCKKDNDFNKSVVHNYNLDEYPD